MTKLLYRAFLSEPRFWFKREKSESPMRFFDETTKLDFLDADRGQPISFLLGETARSHHVESA